MVSASMYAGAMAVCFGPRVVQLSSYSAAVGLLMQYLVNGDDRGAFKVRSGRVVVVDRLLECGMGAGWAMSADGGCALRAAASGAAVGLSTVCQ